MAEVTGNFLIDDAIRRIEDNYGDLVSVKGKRKALRKFGRNANVGQTRSDVQQFAGSETTLTMLSDNLITKVCTDDPDFTGQMKIEGHTIDSVGLLTFSSQTHTLTGNTPVDLDPPLRDATHIAPASVDNLASGKKVYVFENTATTNGVPNDTSKVHVILDQSYGRSQKAATSISSTDYWIITAVYGGLLKKTSAYADIEMRAGKVGWMQETLMEIPVYSVGNPYQNLPLSEAIIIPKNSDWVMTASCSTTGCDVIAGAAGVLAKVIGRTSAS